jgi:hypothetical protein
MKQQQQPVVIPFIEAIFIGDRLTLFCWNKNSC